MKLHASDITTYIHTSYTGAYTVRWREKDLVINRTLHNSLTTISYISVGSHCRVSLLLSSVYVGCPYVLSARRISIITFSSVYICAQHHILFGQVLYMALSFLHFLNSNTSARTCNWSFITLLISIQHATNWKLENLQTRCDFKLGNAERHDASHIATMRWLLLLFFLPDKFNLNILKIDYRTFICNEQRGNSNHIKIRVASRSYIHYSLVV